VRKCTRPTAARCQWRRIVQTVTGKCVFLQCFFGRWAEPDLPTGYIGLSLGPQDPKGPPGNLGTHRFNCRYMITPTNIRQNFMP